jgi:hypothetical protein
MNLWVEAKKMRERAGARSRFVPGLCMGEGPGKLFSRYFAAAAVLTAMLSPFTVPVTVAFLPAC